MNIIKTKVFKLINVHVYMYWYSESIFKIVIVGFFFLFQMKKKSSINMDRQMAG